MDGPSRVAAEASNPGRGSDLFDEVVARLADGNWESWSESEFQRRAVVSFRHQYEACPPYRALCARRGVTPENVGAWQDIPAVPATAFKHFDFLSWPGADEHVAGSVRRRDRAGTGETEGVRQAEGSGGARGPEGTGAPGAVFRTSGTTGGADVRGRHPVPRLDLYEASLAEPFRRALLPEIEGAGACADSDGPLGASPRGSLFLSLIPSPEDLPDSSLSFMVGAAARRFASDVVWLVDGRGGWRRAARTDLRDRIAAAGEAGEPTLVLGTALAYLHLLEGPDAGSGTAVPDLTDLPEDTRFMETGGFKGVRRDVPREELYGGIEAHTGVPRSRIVNEYGMTELLSQLYEPVLSEGQRAAGEHVPPPWLRVRAVDPVSLAPMPEGEEGILAFFDLANLGSVCHILTEDVGVVADGRVRLRGRAVGSEPRGCSRAMDELLRAVDG